MQNPCICWEEDSNPPPFMNFVEIEMMTDSKDLKYHLLQIKNNVDG